MTLMACSENQDTGTMNQDQSGLENPLLENEATIDLPAFSTEEMMASIEWLAPMTMLG